MGADRKPGDWVEDFSIMFRRDAIRSIRGGSDFEIFTGSKITASLWLGLVACLAGGLGGLLVSGALWQSFLYPPAWLAGTAGIAFLAWRLSHSFFDGSLAFLAGWCIFWGILAAAIALWAAELSSPGWAYGIAGGIGFLIGITHGNLQHADIRGHEAWFTVGAFLAPASLCLAVALNRYGLPDNDGFFQAALTGTVAALLFLGPLMALYMAKWNNHRALLKLASLYLHHDDFVAESIRLLDIAIRRTPNDAALFDRRALGHALKGDMVAAEADWSRHRALAERSRASEVARGWLLLRQGQVELAAAAFDKALSGRAAAGWAAVGRGIAALRLNQPQAAIDALGRLPAAEQDARSLTYLAQAHLMLGNMREAIRDATDAIDELDSIFGLSWLVRAEAEVKLGNTDKAILAFNRALENDDELGIEERAMEGLLGIDGPVLEEHELEALEKRLQDAEE